MKASVCMVRGENKMGSALHILRFSPCGRPAVSFGKKCGRGLRIAHKGVGRPHTNWHRHHSTLARASAATSPTKTVVSAPLLSGLPGIKKGAAAESQHLRLHQEGQNIILEGGMPLLEGLSEQGFVNSVTDDSLVLGFESPGGATSMIDIAVGQVGPSPRSPQPFLDQMMCGNARFKSQLESHTWARELTGVVCAVDDLSFLHSSSRGSAKCQWQGMGCLNVLGYMQFMPGCVDLFDVFRDASKGLPSWES